MITSFHEDMQGIVRYYGSTSDPIKSGVMALYSLPHSCSHTLRHLFLPAVVLLAFSQSEDGMYLHTRSDGNLFSLARLLAKTKVRKLLIREMLFADGTALTAHTDGDLRQLTSSFAHACSEFGLKISLKKSNILCRDVSSIPNKRAPLATTLLRWWRTSLT